jgi:outer membrane receptor for ferrienterochelin and colicin
MITGSVTGTNGETLIGANVISLESLNGTSTEDDGTFELQGNDIEHQHLIVSYVGYTTDTFCIEETTLGLTFPLEASHTLDEVEIQAEKPGTYISSINPIKTEVITSVELTKSACCDLAGCFNTQASVEPVTTNIITNAKELRILGLSGVYNQVLVDGMPMIQGSSYTYGVSTVPGTLIDKIYVSKGANSVLQGFESISGQINVELKDPEECDKFYFNALVNSFFEKQFNVNYSQKLKNWSTVLAAHTTQPANKVDHDDDLFLDLPLLTRYSIYNKWKFGDQDVKGWHSKVGLRYVNEKRIGGQKDFNPDTDEGTLNNYGQTVSYSQPEIYTKTGYRFNDKHKLVFMGSAFNQDQNSWFGTTNYKVNHKNLYANLQYELEWLEKHVLKTGVSYRNNDLEEDISFSQFTDKTYGGNHLKQESIPGIFAENTFNSADGKFTLIAGVRFDNHNQFGLFITPRSLLKYNLSESTTARVSVGSGWRTISLFSENTMLLASSRDVIITEELKPEQAINYGVNLTHKIFGTSVESQVTIDFYRTQFSNQIFPDFDSDPLKAFLTNFTGTSISNGFQTEVSFDFFKKVKTKFAYNYLDVYRIIEDNHFELPFNAKHRLTGTFSYSPREDNWHFDMNIHWYGSQRLPKTENAPVEYRLPETSDPYTLINAQVTKSWKQLELYAGCENIFDFRQKQPILSWQDPFGPWFDTASVWGPTRGREFYLGLRYRIE